MIARLKPLSQNVLQLAQLFLVMCDKRAASVKRVTVSDSLTPLAVCFKRKQDCSHPVETVTVTQTSKSTMGCRRTVLMQAPKASRNCS